jgi:predicted Rdx family selenoprotein
MPHDRSRAFDGIGFKPYIFYHNEPPAWELRAAWSGQPACQTVDCRFHEILAIKPERKNNGRQATFKTFSRPVLSAEMKQRNGFRNGKNKKERFYSPRRARGTRRFKRMKFDELSNQVMS